jgi:hypothetical protein
MLSGCYQNRFGRHSAFGPVFSFAVHRASPRSLMGFHRFFKTPSALESAQLGTAANLQSSLATRSPALPGQRPSVVAARRRALDEPSRFLRRFA